MKALYFDSGVSLRDIPLRDPVEGEAVVRVLLAGVCKTDIEITKGYMAFRGVLGHEFVGLVEHADDPDLKGRRVVGEINAGCGKCAKCSAGMERHCKNRTVLGIAGRDGAMAEYLILPAKNLVPVPQGVSDEAAVLTEPLAAALEILEQVKIEPHRRVLVVGDGRLALMICMVLRLTGADLRLVGKHPHKMAAANAVGVTSIPLDRFRRSDDVFDVVVEASGSPSGWDLAVQRVEPRGTIVLKSTYAGGMDFNPAPLVINEITVVGSRCGQFAPALRLLDQGLLNPSSLITGRYSMDEALEAFQAAQDPRHIKVILRIAE
ncbi:MAG: alcohol dehydrogenase catalytic domain-containing protein [Pseudomonadota bacterium]